MPDTVLSIYEVIKNGAITIIPKRQLRSEKLHHKASNGISRVQIRLLDDYISSTALHKGQTSDKTHKKVSCQFICMSPVIPVQNLWFYFLKLVY